MDAITLIGAALLGALLGALLVRWISRGSSTPAATADWLELKQQLATQTAHLQARDEQAQEWRQQREQAQRNLEGLRQRVETLTRELATLTAELDAERRHAKEKIELLTQEIGRAHV